MKIFFKKIKAFTMTELTVVLLIVGIISVLGIKIFVPEPEALYRYSYYSAYITLKNAVSKVLAEGCSAADVTSTYCTATTGVLPSKNHTTAGARSLCSRLSDKINTIGTIDCTKATTTTFTTANVNFTAATSARYFNFNTAAPYTIYVDINGPVGDAVLGVDVLPFTITATGTVLPYFNSGNATASVGATSTDYMTAAVSYKDVSSNTIWVDSGVSYRTAVCRATGSYNGTACTQATACTTNTCSVVEIKPQTNLIN